MLVTIKASAVDYHLDSILDDVGISLGGGLKSQDLS
jgi:hypothetical protein